MDRTRHIGNQAVAPCTEDQQGVLLQRPGRRYGVTVARHTLVGRHEHDDGRHSAVVGLGGQRARDLELGHARLDDLGRLLDRRAGIATQRVVALLFRCREDQAQGAHGRGTVLEAGQGKVAAKARAGTKSACGLRR